MKNYVVLYLVMLANISHAQIFDPPVIKANGNCLPTRISLYNGGSLDYLSVKTYDTQGNLTKNGETFSQRLNGPYTSEYDYAYDAKGNNTSVIFKQNGQQVSVITKVYNALGKLTQETLAKDGTGTTATASIADNALGSTLEKVFGGGNNKEIKQFDKLGNLLSQQSFDANGKLITSTVNSYNIFGKLSETVQLDGYTNVTEDTKFDYNTGGNIVTETTLRNQAAFGKVEYTYDTKGVLTKKTHSNYLNQIDYYFTYEYDVTGKLMKQSYFASNQLILQTVYEYDGSGNKTKESYLDKNNQLNGYKVWEFSCK